MRPCSARGLALLLVLAMFVLVSSAATAMFVQSMSRAFDATVRRDAEVATALALAAEGCVRSWLEARADLVVLPPTREVQGVPVLREGVLVGIVVAMVEINAFDQYAMLPVRTLMNDDALREHLPTWANGLLLRRDGWADPLSIDLPQPPARGERPTRFPTAPSDDRTGSSTRASLATLVASHNPAPLGGTEARTSGRIARLNVNTAPLPVLLAAAGTLGMSDVEHIVQSRDTGRPASTRLLRAHEPAADGDPIELVSVSDAWSFRIDVVFRSCRISNWVTFVRGPEGWALAQRLPIDE